ncbi:DUF3124 domain-containing protein [Pseudotamlana agarivorans]|uniref:DUF3124 domain-containing protein n=1 Tax=Pseudotamlana agarivorans TaxID=481183 RepID=UPI0008325F28|nr:DUF3124 domain-containing protein [Tamlana agarivorans]
MKQYFLFIVFIFSFVACEKQQQVSSIHPENWSKRTIDISHKDSLQVGASYLSIYSQIFSLSESKTHNLTAMVSLRNTSLNDTIYIEKADYYDTHGTLVRSYFEKTIFLAPLETAEIIIDEVDVSGGTGSNFIFEWKIPQNTSVPLFEGIMNSTVGQQGLSFTTQAVRIK